MKRMKKTPRRQRKAPREFETEQQQPERVKQLCLDLPPILRQTPSGITTEDFVLVKASSAQEQEKGPLSLPQPPPPIPKSNNFGTTSADEGPGPKPVMTTSSSTKGTNYAWGITGNVWFDKGNEDHRRAAQGFVVRRDDDVNINGVMEVSAPTASTTDDETAPSEQGWMKYFWSVFGYQMKPGRHA